jgi:DNA mismatch repair protein MLH1
MVASKPGTQFTIEDMFFNIPIRRKSFRSPGEEYTKIVDLLGKYAIHCEGIAFACKKQGEAGNTLSIQAKASSVDRIRQIFGAVADDLVEYDISNDKWGFKARGWASSANYHGKKTTFLLFVNHRLVESNNIKRMLEQTYLPFLPKGDRPFVYLELDIRPDHVDVNLHPTKRVVGLVHEDEITQVICEHIREKLAEVDHSRSFVTRQPTQAVNSQAIAAGDAAEESRSQPKRQRRYSNTMVRTDASSQKITSMFKPVERAAAAAVVAADDTGDGADDADGAGSGDESPDNGEEGDHASSSNPQVPRRDVQETINYEDRVQEPTPISLVSIAELRSAVREQAHQGMTEMMGSHTYVGVVDETRRLAAVQGGIKLFLVDYGRACYEYMYQLGLTDFSNFGVINFRPPLDVRELINISVEYRLAELSKEAGFDRERHVAEAAESMIVQREMLAEYFQLEITPTGELRTLPLMVQGYTPPLAKLPQLLHNIGTRIEWQEEKPCLDQLLHEIASFYVPEELPTMPGNDEDMISEVIDDETRTRRQNVRWAMEHIFFPAFKQRLTVTKCFATSGIWEMANLKDMYKDFERC